MLYNFCQMARTKDISWSTLDLRNISLCVFKDHFVNAWHLKACEIKRVGPNWRTLQLLSSWTCCRFRRFETGPPTCKNINISINISIMYVFKHIPLSPTIMATKNKLPFFGDSTHIFPPVVVPVFSHVSMILGASAAFFPSMSPKVQPPPGINSINLLHHCKCNSLGTCKCGFWSDIPWKNPGMVLL